MLRCTAENPADPSLAMETELAIYRQDGGTCHVLLEDGRPAELLAGSSGSDESAGDFRMPLHRLDILLGQVRQSVPALAGAFVNIGMDHDAFLPIADASSGLKAGQSLLVQIRRLNNPGKGHQVTTQIQLPGPFAVFNPQGAAKRRSKLRQFAADRQEDLFLQDLARLDMLWNQIVQDSGKGPVPRLLFAAGDPLYQALTSFVSADLRRIRVEGEELFRQVYDLVQKIMPPYLPLLSLYVPAQGYGLAAALGLGDLPESLANRKVWLPGGGYLVIDRTEAMTVIDVNSGKDLQGRDNHALRQRINNQAATEIARQLRLRNIGGIILIDFLDLAGDESRQELLSVLETALARDKARHRLVGFTGLGLMEMTRTAR
ncbi:MAG TPA: hypothetical protein DD640_04070 [Clostridiales bacterium]|nr:hypothetical protein [Clostridiales bacterium]